MNRGTSGGDTRAAPAASDAGDPRVLLAIERTFLAWTRTALALMAFGFVVGRMGLFLRELAGPGPGALRQSSGSIWLGSAIVVLGIAIEAFALIEHRSAVGRFRRGEGVVSRGWSLSAFVGLALIGIGLGIVAYLTQLL